MKKYYVISMCKEKQINKNNVYTNDGEYAEFEGNRLNCPVYVYKPNKQENETPLDCLSNFLEDFILNGNLTTPTNSPLESNNLMIEHYKNQKDLYFFSRDLKDFYSLINRVNKYIENKNVPTIKRLANKQEPTFIFLKNPWGIKNVYIKPIILGSENFVSYTSVTIEVDKKEYTKKDYNRKVLEALMELLSIYYSEIKLELV